MGSVRASVKDGADLLSRVNAVARSRGRLANAAQQANSDRDLLGAGERVLCDVSTCEYESNEADTVTHRSVNVDNERVARGEGGERRGCLNENPLSGHKGNKGGEDNDELHGDGKDVEG